MTPFPKVVLLLLSAISIRVGLKPPTPPPSKDDNVYKGQVFERVVRLTALFGQVSVIVCLLSECAVLLSLHFPSSLSPRIISTLCPRFPSSFTHLSDLSPSLLLGVSTMISSAALRVWCYKTLGTLFTFEITTKPEHKLVTTGPYAYIRHPGYTGGVLVLLGAATTCLAPGSYVNECHIIQTPVRWWIGAWFTCLMFSTVSLWRRGRIEDELLRHVFGKTWERYSEVVPYRFMPGIY